MSKENFVDLKKRGLESLKLMLEDLELDYMELEEEVGGDLMVTVEFTPINSSATIKFIFENGECVNIMEE